MFNRLRTVDGVSIAGGEPLTHPEIAEIVRMVAEDGHKPMPVELEQQGCQKHGKGNQLASERPIRLAWNRERERAELSRRSSAP